MRRALHALFLSSACSVLGAPSQVTIYSDAFAAIRESIPLDLHAGSNDVHCTAVSSYIDPGSVVLRDPTGRVELDVTEQTFRNDILTQESLLKRFEGQTINFLANENGKRQVVRGRIVRGKYVRSLIDNEKDVPPVVEVDGAYQFDLPGIPQFPSIPPNSVTRPEMTWKVTVPNPVKLDAELAFTTDGFVWESDYEAIALDQSNDVRLTGWITLRNFSGMDIEDANVTVVAGDVRRVDPPRLAKIVVTGSSAPYEVPDALKSKRFDEYREYPLPRPVSLIDGQTAQIRFLQVPKVSVSRSYVYEGSPDSSRIDGDLTPQMGTNSEAKVSIVTEFKNSADNHLGIPLPLGRVHFYQLDPQKHLQFLGDVYLNNTPPGETVRLIRGSALNLVGERKQTNFHVDDQQRTAEESLEIRLRNHGKDDVEIRVLEHPFRWREWEIISQSSPFKKLDAGTVEFRVPVKPEEEKTITYSVRYSKLPIKALEGR